MDYFIDRKSARPVGWLIGWSVDQLTNCAY